VRWATGAALAIALLLGPHPAAGQSNARLEPDELAARQRATDRHLLRVQQERFEAQARGDEPRRLKRLEREFRRTQQRRRDLARAAERAARTD
jgi:hypothetical protein